MSWRTSCLSPYVLIQETLFPNEFRVLVSCVMLNQTSRKQVEKVFREFFTCWPYPEDVRDADQAEMAGLLKPLGFMNKRSVALKKLAAAYLEPGWCHAKELPGIGEYGARAWEIFCLGLLGEETPKDGALAQYWLWRTQMVIFAR